MKSTKLIVAATLLISMIAADAAVVGKINPSSLRCWENGEQPEINLSLDNPDSSPTTATVTLSLTSDKRYVVQPTLGHTVAPDWYRAYIDFFSSLK